MIINNAPTHEAVLSNVGEIGEFRIRNSAKAFNILSSGLYANKIRAIIRELSCNAVDSHTAAGKQEVPFDVHLPNQLDPTFRIRDYGTGLSHEQVLSIYTTYFESTKTESNQFIGALGLGSKSPFSYTDNFTVTAVKNGRRNVYSAFINGEGVPSIALMHDEDTTEPNGVEVQFAVTDRWDYDKFYSEAREVFTYFKLRPVVSGGDREFSFRDVEYKDKNIIPGVHYLSGRGASRAVMGNIAYPIDVPNAESNLGELRRLLGCGLEMHFEIGELDFQASREGLSYIPSTIEAIKQKLIALEAQLAVHVALEADAIDNAWEKVYFLQRKAHEDLFAGATRTYIAVNTVAMLDPNQGHYVRAVEQKFNAKQLASRYNISILAFSKTGHSVTCSDVKPSRVYPNNNYNGPHEDEWHFSVSNGTIFVVNDLKVGAMNRAKYHWRTARSKNIDLPNAAHNHYVYVLSAATKGHAMDVQGFFADLNSPPVEQILHASNLLDKPRKDNSPVRGANVTIMSMQKRGYGGYHKEREMVWKDAGKADSFDNANETFYYVPLKGYEIQTKDVSIPNMQNFHNLVTESGIPGLQGISIYGVRKTDIDYISRQKNWVNVQDHIRSVMAKVDAQMIRQCALKELDLNKVFRYNKDIAKLLPTTSAFRQFVEQFQHIDSKINRHALERLCKDYGTPVEVDPVLQSVKDELTAIRNRYPLLSSLRDYDINEVAVAQYINLIDKEA